MLLCCEFKLRRCGSGTCIVCVKPDIISDFYYVCALGFLSFYIIHEVMSCVFAHGQLHILFWSPNICLSSLLLCYYVMMFILNVTWYDIVLNSQLEKYEKARDVILSGLQVDPFRYYIFASLGFFYLCACVCVFLLCIPVF